MKRKDKFKSIEDVYYLEILRKNNTYKINIEMM